MKTIEIAREIGKMPFYQVHYTQKSILRALKNKKIPQSVIDEAKRRLNNQHNNY